MDLLSSRFEEMTILFYSVERLWLIDVRDLLLLEETQCQSSVWGSSDLA